MNKSDIIRKLSSRKLWLAVALFVSGLITAFGGSGDTASTVAGCIMQGGAVIAYILAEGWADVASQTAPVVLDGVDVEVMDGVDVEDLTDDQLRELLAQMGLSRTYIDGLTRSQLLAALDNLETE